MLDSALFERKKAKLVGRELKAQSCRVKLSWTGGLKCKINCIEPRERLRLLLGGIQRSTEFMDPNSSGRFRYLTTVSRAGTERAALPGQCNNEGAPVVQN